MNTKLRYQLNLLRKNNVIQNGHRLCVNLHTSHTQWPLSLIWEQIHYLPGNYNKRRAQPQFADL